MYRRGIAPDWRFFFHPGKFTGIFTIEISGIFPKFFAYSVLCCKIHRRAKHGEESRQPLYIIVCPILIQSIFPI